ncbi:MAG: Acetate kinase [Nocardioidaceae bacterium]|nr:Acetate kinase [Nocardioidaceae bacterium]
MVSAADTASDSAVLVLNAGSSSLRYELVDAGSGERSARGRIDPIGDAEARHRHGVGEDDGVARPVRVSSYDDAVRLMFDAFAADGPSLEHVVGVGHRVVHGGATFTGPVVVDPDVVDAIESLVPLAPLHNPAALACIRAVSARLTGTTQVAVFDTSFHATVPDAATAFALPREVVEPHGLRRYGFHGTSVEYVVGRTAELLGRAVSATSLVVCHLGNGASVTAVRNGVSIDTSMGFAPLGGLVMGTRSGDVDAAVVLYLIDQAGMPVSEVEDLLNRRSGLLALAGDSDMHRVRARAEQGDADAVRAVALVAHRIRAYVGAAVAQLPDLDALVFTGGIGEHDAALRDEVTRPLAHLPIPCVLVVPTDEEHQIAVHTLALVNQPAQAHTQPKDTHVDHPAA